MMLDRIDHLAFAWLNAPAHLGGVALAGAMILAEWVIYLVPGVLLVLWWCGADADRRAAVQALLTALLALAIGQVIGFVWFHPRPFVDGLGHQYLAHAPDSSFPSDHVLVMLSVGFTLWATHRRWLRGLGIALVMAGVAVGWARVFLGVHYPFDILGAGVVAGLAMAVVNTGVGRSVSRRLTAVLASLQHRCLVIPGARLWRATRSLLSIRGGS